MNAVTAGKHNLHAVALRCLAERDVQTKLALTWQAVSDWQQGRLTLAGQAPPVNTNRAGQPDRPQLVTPAQLPKRSAHTDAGRAALIHAIAHIEFNAINLAWDAVYRFRGMPVEYYADWVRVAGEEAAHFLLLRDHLHTLGYDYGDFEAHNGLWEMAQKTAHDPLVRMALVPRVLEARGLDVTPAMIERLKQAGDRRAVEILDVILREEIDHVAIGSRWFHYLCNQRGVDAGAAFRQLLDEYMRGRIKGPLHREARLRAGFSKEELDYLEQL
jgi:uncharacterized ferritin-like protein (DUF455 family)